jgi:cytochrome c-type biogenesis protein CcmH/NrfG
VQAWIALSATLAKEGHTSDAQQAAESALKIDPNNIEALELRRNLTDGQALR